MIVSESDIEFTFGEQYGNLVLKYDDTPYYTERFNAQPGAKAVDFIAVSDKHYVLIEVKNCIGDESGNRWRIAPNNQKRDTVGADGRDVSTRDSLDIEVAQKTAMTLAGMLGAFSNPMPATKHASCDAFEHCAVKRLQTVSEKSWWYWCLTGSLPVRAAMSIPSDDGCERNLRRKSSGFLQRCL